MNHPEIETARLRLRPQTIDDVDAFYRLWNEPVVRKHLWDDEPVSLERAKTVIDASVDLFQSRGFGIWVVVHKANAKLIGFCGFRLLDDTAEIELLYGISESYWGQGLAVEAAKACIRFGFEAQHFERITGAADIGNTASQWVMAKAGMVFSYQKGDVKPLMYYTISCSDFQREDSTYILTR